MHTNYVKIVDGIPTQEFSLEKPENGEWLEFDAEIMNPQALAIQGGIIVEDPVKKNLDFIKKENVKARTKAMKDLRKSGMDKLKVQGLTIGELKSLFREQPTDEELGI